MTTTTKVDWGLANCIGIDTDMFMEYEAHASARRVCARCPIAADCYFEAVQGDLSGTWGGVFFGKPGRARLRSDKASTTAKMRVYRAELCNRLGLTLDQFVTRYGPAYDGLRKALRRANA